MHSFFQPLNENTIKITGQAVESIKHDSVSHAHEDSFSKVLLIEKNAGYSPNGISLIRRKNLPYKGWVLKPEINGTWLIYDSTKNTVFAPKPEILYIFVTMPDSTIRIALRSTHSHGMLAGFTEYVRYAGDMVFDEKQAIKKWSNNSTTFCPPAELHWQAGFANENDKFCNEIVSSATVNPIVLEEKTKNLSTLSIFAKNNSFLALEEKLSEIAIQLAEKQPDSVKLTPAQYI